MRRKICLIIVFTILITVIFSLVSCSENKTIKLSELEDEALMQILDEEGLTIPKGYKISQVRYFLAIMEADPDRPMAISNPSFSEFLEELRVIVKRNGNTTP